jgi:hypothetical protein
MTLLGHDPQGQNVWIYPKDRLTGCYVIGANGTGKSTLLLNMISQDIEQGFGVCLLDPHGDLTNAVINRIPDKRINDVILLNPLDVDYPFGLNLFTCSDMKNPAKVEHTVEQIVQIFSKVFGMSVETPRLNQYVRQISYVLVGSGYTMCEIPLLLLDKPFRDKVTINVSSTATRLFWKSFEGLRTTEQLERSESTLDRIDSLISNSIIRNIVGQSSTTINFRDIMDSSKILLVSLSAQYESLTSLLGSIIIGQLLTASLSRAGTSKRRQFNLYADEYQRFATPDFATLLTEARKFGVATTIAHQVRSQLDEKNAATALQAGSLVCFRVTAEDADELAAEFDCTPPTASKPPGTIPADVFNHFPNHPFESVKRFWREYIQPWQLAITLKDQSSEELLRVGMYRTLYTSRKVNGETQEIRTHVVEFDPQELRKALTEMEKFFYWIMKNKPIADIENKVLDDLKDEDQTTDAWAEKYLDKKYTTMRWTVFPCGASDTFMKTIAVIEGFSLYYTLMHDAQEHPAFANTYIDNHLDDFDSEKSDAYKNWNHFLFEMEMVLDALTSTPIEVQDTSWNPLPTVQQTYTDRKNQIANELVLLKRGHARVRLPGGEYLMETIPDTSSHAQSTKKAQIIDYTRKKYCNLRQNVEEEIYTRQTHEEPPSRRRDVVK